MIPPQYIIEGVTFLSFTRTYHYKMQGLDRLSQVKYLCGVQNGGIWIFGTGGTELDLEKQECMNNQIRSSDRVTLRGVAVESVLQFTVNL